MSRVVELIKRFVTDTGQAETSVESLRLSNEPRGGNSHTTVRMTVALKNGTLDKTFYNSLMGVGIYVDDIFMATRPDGQSLRISDLSNLNSDEIFDSIEISFSFEKKPITGEQLVKTLQAETIFGLPYVLFKNWSIANLKIYYGANRDPLNLLININQQTRSYKSHPFLIDHTKSSQIEFSFIDDRSTLNTVKRPITDYLDEELMQSLTRHAYTPKVGLAISSLFPAHFFTATVPLASWDFIRTQAGLIVKEDLERHTKSQVERISRRINEVQRRQKVFHGGVELGLAPINEVETVLLFQKIALSFPKMLPGGLKVLLLDYSPKDIDSICKFQLSPNHPEETGPVEFEFSLSSFFKHGHDYRQVKLIICYTAEPLVFPYTHGGINYALDRSGPIPRLTNRLDHSSIPCLIIEDLFK
jgi:hypothetical protein